MFVAPWWATEGKKIQARIDWVTQSRKERVGQLNPAAESRNPKTRFDCFDPWKKGREDLFRIWGP